MLDLNHSRNLTVRSRADCFQAISRLAGLVMGVLGLMMLASQVTAQTFTTLYSFTAGGGAFGNNSDGASPAGLISSGNTLYGTARRGGTASNFGGGGTLFTINIDGTGFTNLHIFTGLQNACPECSQYVYTNGDGANPAAGLILSSNTLYGMASTGGSSGNGTVFAVNTNGMGFTILHSFSAGSGSFLQITNSDGAFPAGGLIQSGGTLYGTTRSGGSSGNGTVFAINTDGSGFTNLHSFQEGGTNSSGAYTNSDGASPAAALILLGNTLYGTAEYGGSSGNGTVFAMNTDGTGFAPLHIFAGTDGAIPVAGLITNLAGDTLFGTASGGGSWGSGTVFAVNTNGTRFTNLYGFTAPSGPNYANSDGASPAAALILLGNTLYGTAHYGGIYGDGTVFAINTDGTGFTNLHNFTVSSWTNSDGVFPLAGLILLGTTLFGTASSGGGGGSGTVFGLSFLPQLTIAPSGANVILTWPTNYAGFDYTGYTLQSTTNLVSPAAWTSVSVAPVVVNGENTVTNSISGTQQFFRLRQ